MRHATGVAWVHGPPQENPRKQGDPEQLPPLFLSSPTMTYTNSKIITTS